MSTVSKKATIYAGGVFGYEKIEATNVSHSLVSYAQYVDAVQIRFVPKRKRLTREMTEGYKPRIVILEGWGHPEPPPIYRKVKTPAGVSYTAYTTRISGSPEIDPEFDEFLKDHLKQKNSRVIADYRGFIPRTHQDMIFSKSLRDRKLGELIRNLIDHAQA